MQETTAAPIERHWHLAAIALLAVRTTQGFVYWGGGSRRFIYDPQKLDPDAHRWMANKFQSAMPGALLGMDQLIACLLQHFWLLYSALILFSAAELVAGMALVTGLLTRVAALASMGFSVLLMLMFGWQGGTCIDEWTMASCNLAMGASLVLAGSGAYSGPYGIVAGMGAKAIITLRPVAGTALMLGEATPLTASNVDGASFSVKLGDTHTVR